MVLKGLFIYLFVLFVFSPQFKNHPWLASYPDITVFFSAILIPWFYLRYIIWRKRQHPVQNHFWTTGTLTIAGFTIWALLSLIWAPQTTYPLSKALSFAWFSFNAYLIAEHQLSRDQFSLGLFYKMMLLFSSVVLFETFRIQFFPLPGEQVNNIFGNNYLVTGQTLGVGALLSFAWALHSYKFKAINGGFLLVFLLHIAALLMIGARGPLLASLIAVVLLGAILAYHNKITRTYSVIGLMGGLFCIVLCLSCSITAYNLLLSIALPRYLSNWTIRP